MIFPIKKNPDEEYPSVVELLRMDDLPTCDVAVPNWKIDGKRVVIHCRALSLRDQETIHRLTRAAAQKVAKAENDPNPEEVNIETHITETWLRGVLMPKFDREQIQGLRSRQAHALSEVTNLIWAISSLDQESVDAAIQRATPANTLAGPAEPDDDRPGE